MKIHGPKKKNKLQLKLEEHSVEQVNTFSCHGKTNRRHQIFDKITALELHGQS